MEEGPVGVEKCVENARGTKEGRRKGAVGCVAGSGLSGAKAGSSCASPASSLRSVMLKLLMEHVNMKMLQDHPLKTSTTKLAKLELQEYDKCRECANGRGCGPSCTRSA